MAVWPGHDRMPQVLFTHPLGGVWHGAVAQANATLVLAVEMLQLQSVKRLKMFQADSEQMFWTRLWPVLINP